MYRKYDDQILRDYFEVSVMYMVNALINESGRRYADNYQSTPGDIYNEYEALNRNNNG